MDIGILFNKLIDEYHKSIKEAKTGGDGDCIPGLTVIQYFYLQEIYREKKTTLTDLSKALDVSKPTANAVVKKLLDEGIIRRIQSEDDQRVYHLSLTKKGTQVFLAEKEIYGRFIRQVIENTTEDEREEIARALETILSCVSKKTPGAKK